MPEHGDEPTASSPPADGRYAFGPFTLDARRRRLQRDGEDIDVRGRQLDLLIGLVRQAGAVVGKRDLMRLVWPDVQVEESNLRVQIAALRRLLGTDGDIGRYVENVPGRGYVFVAPVRVLHERMAAAGQPGERIFGLPAVGQQPIGRDAAMRDIAMLLRDRRLVTIVGPGGIGKTTLALAVAHAIASEYPDIVLAVDLTSVADARLVASALASRLRVAIRSKAALPALAAALDGKSALLVLDGCEHVVDAAAALCEGLLRQLPDVHVLATSREPLRAEGEWVYRLRPLPTPPPGEPLSPDLALGYPAIRLFVDRATAAVADFDVRRHDVDAIADICRQLDGMPLAIELGASLIEAFGVRDISDRLRDRFILLSKGRRTALPRHQTLAAALDWSFELLQEPERRMLARLAVFPGRFTLEDAVAVTADDPVGRLDVPDLLANLVSKSLVVAEFDGSQAIYRLLDTTRIYARDKLAEQPDGAGLARRHALHVCALLNRARAEAETTPHEAWLARYGGQIDDARAALDWAFAETGERALAVALTAATVVLWTSLSLSDECRQRVEQALALLDPETGQGARPEMELCAALGWSLMQTSGPFEAARAAFARMLAIAERTADPASRLRAHWGLWIYHFNRLELDQALAIARGRAAESTGDGDLVVTERMLGLTLHLVGDQANAQRHIENMLLHYRNADRRSTDVRFGFNQSVTGRSYLARILWLRGFPEQAARMAQENVAAAQQMNHVLTLANALAQGGWRISLWNGDLAAAERYTVLLRDTATRHSLAPWLAWARCFEAIHRLRHGAVDQGLGQLGEAMSDLQVLGYTNFFAAFLAERANALGQVGQLDRGIAVIDEALAMLGARHEHWCLAELLRIKASLLARSGAADAEAIFEQSLAYARQQQVLAWELRSATSLARLWRRQGRTGDALALLEPVYGRFTEGFATADLVAASTLLRRLREA